jgi:flagellar L-ring protein precursor FlgH
MRPLPHAGLAALLVAVLTGCAFQQARYAEYKPKRRDYDFPPAGAPKTPEGKGSLWVDDRPSGVLFADARAIHVNDLVVVKVEESADARRSADTDISSDGSAGVNASGFAKLVQLVQMERWSVGNKSARRLADDLKGLDPLTASASSASKSAGTTGRSEKLTATVPALVRQELPNGNLFIEGHRVVLVNSEEHHFYVSGVIRRFDIDGENSIKSSMIADAEIEFTGKGVLSNNQQGVSGFFRNLFGLD